MEHQNDYVHDETPNRCGCGRSPNGYCIGLHSLTGEALEKWQAENQKTEDTVVQ